MIEKTGDRNRDEAQKLLAGLLIPVMRHNYLLKMGFDATQEVQAEWEESIELFCWHMIQCAAEKGRGQIQS